jgi:tripartite-type tricarboxylate transporter receptor subunit TctC
LTEKKLAVSGVRLLSGIWCLFIAVPILGHAEARSQPYPVRPIRFIVPTTPAGPTDTLARVLAERLSKVLGQQVVVDNRPGAGGRIGIEVASKSGADGYTIFMGSQGNLTVHPALHHKLPYDLDKDFAPIVLLVRVRYLLLVNPRVPANSLTDLLNLFRSRPGQFNFASVGRGSSGHIAAELLKRMAQVDIVHVQYKGSGPALGALINGEVQLMFQSPVVGAPFIKSGLLRPIAISAPHRSPLFPEVPTFEESGLPGFEVSTWFGVMTRAGVSSAIVTMLNEEINRILRLEDVRARLELLDAEPAGGSVSEFAAHIRSERVKWAKVIKETGIVIE